MGERVYTIGEHDLCFSEMDDDWVCLCTFPHNDTGELTPDRVRSLALLGAAVVLAMYDREQLSGEFLPFCVPEWIRSGIAQAVPIAEDGGA